MYGGKTRVTAALRTVAGAAVAGKQVNLLARVSPSAHWRRVASGTTGARGRVTLPVSVSATSALRLRHPASSVRAGDAAVRRVAVAKRVTVAAAGTRTRMGAAVTVRGRVAPGQRVGSRVRLQRRVSGSWTSIASGRMTTRQRFAIRWEPTRVGGHVLRVARAGGSVRATGYSARWRHRIIAESAADIASDILRNGAITLATVHVGGIRDQATPEQNIVDTAAGRAARRSCHGNAPCGSVAIDLRVLRAIRAMGAKTTITVSEINGGHHAGGSAHYSGRAVDITWVNDRHVYRGTAYGMAVDVCRTHGASQILTPSNDPWGGHSNHVHCGWS